MFLSRVIENNNVDNLEIDLEIVSEMESAEFDKIFGHPGIEDLLAIEMDRRLVTKVRARASLFAEIFVPNTEFIYGYPFRKRVEVEGGYKIARRRGARLNEVNVYHLVVRFKNSIMNCSEALAFMYRPLNKSEEWIVLLPDDTEDTINREVYTFQSAAQLFQESGKLSPELTLDHIIENLKLLNIHERCAQTLMHEYGHILHWRIFDRLEDGYVYNWFVKSGYAQLIDGRVPVYHRLCDEDKVWMLKECLVEDYRIFLNQTSENGKFILPGKYTYTADLRAPELLNKGVDIMQRMLQPAIENENMRRRTGTTDREVTDFGLMQSILEASMDDKWVPGQQRMTLRDHHAVTDRLFRKETDKQVAAATHM